MRLIPHMDAIEIECETPMEHSVIQRWVKCNADLQLILDYGASGPTGQRGLRINFKPKPDALVPSSPQPTETGQAGFRG